MRLVINLRPGLFGLTPSLHLYLWDLDFFAGPVFTSLHHLALICYVGFILDSRVVERFISLETFRTKLFILLDLERCAILIDEVVVVELRLLCALYRKHRVIPRLDRQRLPVRL